MKRSTWTRLRPVLERLLELDATEREAFLDEACGEDHELRRAALGALERERTDEDFLEPPEIPTPDAAERVAEGDRLGAWRLVRRIGAGGMGDVWLAERADDAFEMSAALKVVRNADAGGSLARRFEQERGVLARLEHPGIARLLDGGAAGDGTPFLVMEHVSGVPLDAYCRQNALAVRDRVELFREVCLAVGYAHRNLVVHRDLKPANVLVDGEGRPRLLDFGIAKLLDTRGPSSGDPTLEGTALTPHYASPEQVRGDPITSASDVYSLGVMLYELVAGRRPYELSDTNLVELVRVVCDREPPPPRSVASPAVRRAIDADFELIVATALAKDPARRYGSADVLAEELGRWLRREPILARPPSAVYQLRSFARRNRVLVGAVLLGLVVLTTATAVSVRSAIVAESRRREAVAAGEQELAARRRADALFATLLDHSLGTTFDFALRIHDLPGAAGVSVDMIEQAVAELELLREQAGDDERVLLALARAYVRLGDVQGNPAHPNLGDTAGAAQSHARALDLARSLAGSAEALRVEAEAGRKLGAMAIVRDDLDEAHRRLERSLELLESVESAGVTDRRELAITLDELAAVLGRMDKPDAAEPHAQRAQDLFEALAAERPDDDFFVLRVATGHQRLAAQHFRRGDYEQALVEYAKAAPLLRAQVERRPDASVTRQKLAWNRMWTGTCEVLLERLEESERSLGLAASDYEELADADPDNRQYDAWLGNVYDMLGNLARTRAEQAGEGGFRHWEAARDHYERALERFSAAAEREPRYAEHPITIEGKIQICEAALGRE